MADSFLQAAFVARLREYLKDTVGPFLWTDYMLRLALDAAIGELSGLFPRQAVEVLSTVGAPRSYGLSHLLEEIYTVWQVRLNGVRLRHDPTIELVDASQAGRYQQAWAHNRDSQRLMLRNAPQGDEIGVEKLMIYFTACHRRWTVDTDDLVTTTSVQPQDWGLLVLLAARGAWRQLALQGIKTPADLDIGQQITALSVDIRRMVRARQAPLRGNRVGW